MISLWEPADYTIPLAEPFAVALPQAARRLFDLVWRTTPAAPGFAVVAFTQPADVDSLAIRRVMLGLVAAFPVSFLAERLGRFDQQVSSKFHRDGGPEASLLLLGYESTRVRSRVLIADSGRAAVHAGLLHTEFVQRFNPMFPAGEAHYLPFVTELALPHGEPHIVAINNSLLPTADAPLGVLHKAVIDMPDSTARRVINSAGFTLPGGPSVTLGASEMERFLSRDSLD